ncbi:MAG: SDR family NAD(P)-dependent oxidoreductase, partial [Methyloceanibacter sp.]
MAQENTPGTALVTGAGRRLGHAIALHLAKMGWRVGVHYHYAEDEALALVEAIEALGGKACALQADLAELAALSPLVATCASRLGAPTCLINN